MTTPNPSHVSMSRMIAAALLIPLLAACGSNAPSSAASARASTSPSASASARASAPATASASAPATGAPSSSATASESAGALPAAAAQLLTCDSAGPGWPVTALDRAANAQAGTAAAAKALAAFVTGPDGANLPDGGWRELYRSRELALYGQDDPSGEPGVLLVVRVRATGGTWSGEDSGQCRPRSWLGSLGIAADWKLAARTSPTSTTMKILVTERACASGQSAKGRIAKPRISYESTRIVITMGVTPLTGTRDCQGNPPTALTITLSEPIGTRKLFDGGPYPALEVAQPT